MQKLIIHNFGPLQNVELEVKDFMVFIGPQATGKSTVAKLVYYFKNLIPAMIYVFEKDYENYIKFNHEVKTQIKEYFKKVFGPIKYQSGMGYVSYIYDNDIEIKIEMLGARLNLEMSENLEKDIFKLYENYNKLSEEIHSYKNSIANDENISRAEYLFKYKPQDIIPLLSFPKNVSINGSLFLAEGRGYLNQLSSNIQDTLIQTIINTKGKHNFNYLGIDSHYNFKYFMNFLYNQKVPDNKILSYTLWEKYLKRVVKSKLVIEKDKMFLVTENTKIDVKYTSSGQRESIIIFYWLRFLLAANIDYYFTCIEEPEGHLYPTSQKDIIEAIVLSYNSMPNNQLIITTHSPYILTSLNNLLYAHKMAQSNPEATEKIISKELWLDVNRFAAYYMSDGKIEPIVDREDTHLIYAERLDDVSAQINETYYQLLDLES